jgi:hypothetical protein
LRTRLILKPGQDGTKKLVEMHGDRLVCVRYRYDAASGKRYKTIELIIDESDWQPIPKPDEVVGVRVAYKEFALRQQVGAAGGKWNEERRLWELRYAQVKDLGLEERMVREEDGVYVVEGADGNLYLMEDMDDSDGWQIGKSQWNKQAGWQTE